MYNLKKAFESAVSELENSQTGMTDIRLEEYDKSTNKIVVSYLIPRKQISVQNILSPPYERVYKEVVLDSSNEVEAVKIYKR